jgi:hypothetical protein
VLASKLRNVRPVRVENQVEAGKALKVAVRSIVGNVAFKEYNLMPECTQSAT